jgi:L,D-transpeptidase YcbB
MSGVRLDRLLASTAVVLLLTGAAGGALAEPKAGSTMEAASTSAPAPTTTPSATDQSDQSATKPGETGDTPQPATKPQASSDQPSALAEPKAAVADQPAPPTESKAASDQPAAAAAEPAPPEAPAASAQDQTPAAVATPAAASPSDAAATAPPAPVVADGNAAIAEQLRDLTNGKFDRIVGGKKERAAVDAFYSARDYAPLWMTDGKPNARADAAIAYLGHVDADGLEPADYPVPNFASLSDPAALAEAELRLTASVVNYAHHAQVGRVHWTRVSGDISYDQKPPAPADVLAVVANASDVAAALDAYEPHHPAYLALKAKLAELRGGNGDDHKSFIPGGPVLKVGMTDDRVPALRARLGVDGDGTAYDKILSDAVKAFQQAHSEKPTGLLTAQTVAALNGRRPDRPIDTIIVNMERWRWAPHELGKNYVIVNLPDFTLRVFENEHQVWMTKIVDGKPEMPTPIMTAEMKYITVNPTWNVPPSIVAREYMPALQQDPTVLERMGLRVSTNPDGTVHISQPPGDANALGRLRFNFPNKFLVYQHDTPNKNLFALDRRALSHGCMRVQDPVKYAEVLLSIVRPGEGYTEERIRRMFAQGEVDIQFPKYLPVHITYQTAFVDDAGKLEFRDDVYGRDKVLLAILKSDERKVADTPVERRENAVNRELLAMPDQSPFGRSFGGGNFFSRLFGGQQAPPTPPAAIPSRKHAANDGRKTRTVEQ